MENIKFLGAANEVQKIYNDLGLLVPVGDLSQGKAPAVQVLPATSTLDSITFNFNVTSSADITSIAYETSSMQTGTITPKKGVVSVTFDSLDYNTELEIGLAVTNASGTTTVSTAAETQHYTDWAEPESVLAGNKFIANGVEMVGEIVTKDSTDLTVNERTVTVPAGYYAENASASVSSDYVIPTGSTTISNNGTDINIAQYATVNVNVPNGTETLNATTNNTYYPTSPNIGFSEVVVNVPTMPTKAAITFDYDTGTKYQIMGTVMTNGDFAEVDGFELTIQEPSEYAGITISSHPAGQKCMKIGENEYVFYQPFNSLPPNVTDLSGDGTIIVVTVTDPMNPQFDEYPITWTCAQTADYTSFTLSNCTLTQVTAPDQYNPYGEWQFSGTSDQDMTQIGLESGEIRLYADDNSTIASVSLEQIDPNDPYTVKSSTFIPIAEVTSSGMYAIGCMYDSNTWDVVSSMPWGTWTNASNH